MEKNFKIESGENSPEFVDEETSFDQVWPFDVDERTIGETGRITSPSRGTYKYGLKIDAKTSADKQPVKNNTE